MPGPVSSKFSPLLFTMPRLDDKVQLAPGHMWIRLRELTPLGGVGMLKKLAGWSGRILSLVCLWNVSEQASTGFQMGRLDKMRRGDG